MSARTEQAFDNLQSNLGPWETIEPYLTRKMLFAALSRSQRQVAENTLCVRGTVELALTADEDEYTTGDGIHAITNVTVPPTWQPVEPVEPENFEDKAIALGSACRQPLIVTTRRGKFVFAPVPTEAATVWLHVVLRPKDDGSQDVSSLAVAPFCPAAYDEAVVLGATADVIRKIPVSLLLNPTYDARYYRAAYEQELARLRAELGRTQTRNPRSQRRPGIEELFQS